MPNYPNADKDTSFFRQYCQSGGQISDSALHLSFLFCSAELTVESVNVEPSEIHVYLKSANQSAVCPYCQQESNKVHSRYTRHVIDLPILGNKCILHVGVRKFFCKNKECGRKTFSEQPGNELFRYRRRTRRCELQVLRTGITCSSNKASTLLSYSGIPVCNTTILRDIHRTELPDHKNVKRIGVDDWAFRKGVEYGSIIIDLDTGHAIDLLGDRGHDSFKSWMDEHSDVRLVSRDRSTEYSSAIASTGRNVCEVADLFHLVKNMSECVSRIISDNYSSYREMVAAKTEPENETPVAKQETAAEALVKEDSRMAMFKEVKRLQALGKKPTWIARNMKIARQTATKYCTMDILPKRKSKCRNEYYKYDAYVEREYSKGKNLTEIYHEIKAQGFKGGVSPYHYHYHYLPDGHRGRRSKKQKEKTAKNAKPIVKANPVLPIRTLSMIVDGEIRNKRHDNEQNADIIYKLSALPWFHEMLVAMKTYYDIMKGKNEERLCTWVNKYRNSTVKQIRTLALGISIDIKAVSNAITTNIRNGITEGFVNKLKEVKRTMYGRAKLELLKRKMILGYYFLN